MKHHTPSLGPDTNSKASAQETPQEEHPTDPRRENEGKPQPAVSARMPDGGLAELVYRPAEGRTAFCVYRDGAWREEPSVMVGGRRLVPYSPGNTLLQNQVVLFPSAPEEYASEEALVAEIRAFIRRYVQVSPLFETIASYYVLLSWVYDGFNELPYLRLRGDAGSGKTRFLLVVGSICYKPIFTSGASTVSPLFRILDAIQGTLIVDEADFRFSDERAEVVKILNNGNGRGMPVLRSEISRTREVSPQAFQVFGPKLIATRGFFDDHALESRCLTEEMGQQTKVREDIPLSLPAAARDEALRLRNQLLVFRFRNLHRCAADLGEVDRTIAPRLAQVFAPLLAVVEDQQARAELQALARQYHREFLLERGMRPEAQVLEVVHDLVQASPNGNVPLKEVVSWFVDRYGEEYDRKVTSRWIGRVLRQLGVHTRKSHGVYVISLEERPVLERLFQRYGVEDQGSKPSAEQIDQS
ncbi:MAG: hypothetical protein WEA09_02360 [Gemmatimonadota bacterium]